MNVDATLFPSQNKVDSGYVVRNSYGQMVMACSSPITCSCSLREAKAISVREALSWIKSKGLITVLLNLIRYTLSKELDKIVIGLVISI